MLVCGDFIYTLEIIVRILREVVNKERLCGTNTQSNLVASAIFGAVRPLAEVTTQSNFVWVVGWCCDAGAGEGGGQCCIDSVLRTPK